MDQISSLFKPDGTIQDIVKALEKDGSEFSMGVLKRMKHMSPLSLAVVFE